jgi:hypothetical protein
MAALLVVVEVTISDQDVWALKLVHLDGGRHLLALVVQLERVEDVHLVEFDLPRDAAQWVARGNGRHDQFGLANLESLPLVKRHQLGLVEGTLNVLQAVSLEIARLFLLDQEFVQSLSSQFDDGACAKPGLMHNALSL